MGKPRMRKPALEIGIETDQDFPVIGPEPDGPPRKGVVVLGAEQIGIALGRARIQLSESVDPACLR